MMSPVTQITMTLLSYTQRLQLERPTVFMMEQHQQLAAYCSQRVKATRGSGPAAKCSHAHTVYNNRTTTCPLVHSVNTGGSVYQP
jgi:hypothetical protein